MLKPQGLISGHYECRRLDDTIPVFTDLLAMDVLARNGDGAVLKHPNTQWRLAVHEGGPEAPDKGFDNHYGFRVGSHREVEAAWEYLEANKEKYQLSKITKPQQAHYAYSVYFNEPGGNTLEIEYYNPGGRCTAVLTPPATGKLLSRRNGFLGAAISLRLLAMALFSAMIPERASASIPRCWDWNSPAG